MTATSFPSTLRPRGLLPIQPPRRIPFSMPLVGCCVKTLTGPKLTTVASWHPILHPISSSGFETLHRKTRRLGFGFEDLFTLFRALLRLAGPLLTCRQGRVENTPVLFVRRHTGGRTPPRCSRTIAYPPVHAVSSCHLGSSLSILYSLIAC